MITELYNFKYTGQLDNEYIILNRLISLRCSTFVPLLTISMYFSGDYRRTVLMYTLCAHRIVSERFHLKICQPMKLSISRGTCFNENHSKNVFISHF